MGTCSHRCFSHSARALGCFLLTSGQKILPQPETKQTHGESSLKIHLGPKIGVRPDPKSDLSIESYGHLWPMVGGMPHFKKAPMTLAMFAESPLFELRWDLIPSAVSRKCHEIERYNITQQKWRCFSCLIFTSYGILIDLIWFMTSQPKEGPQPWLQLEFEALPATWAGRVAKKPWNFTAIHDGGLRGMETGHGDNPCGNRMEWDMSKDTWVILGPKIGWGIWCPSHGHFHKKKNDTASAPPKSSIHPISLDGNWSYEHRQMWEHQQAVDRFYG